MEDVDKMENSLLKNMGEFSEFAVFDLKVNNYYDLVDLIVDLYNFRATAYRKNQKFAKEIMNEIKNEL